MLKSGSMVIKKKARIAKREAGLSNRKKGGLGWDSALKIVRSGFEPRTKKEAKAHQVKMKKKGGK